MKKILLITLSIFSIGIVSAQTSNTNVVPAAAKSKMSTMYPAAKGVSWSQSAKGSFESAFTLNKQQCTATFANTGEWVSTDFTITKAEFPQAASTYLTNVGYTENVTRYYRTESKAQGTQYSADAKINGTMYTFIFDQDGNLVMRGLKD